MFIVLLGHHQKERSEPRVNPDSTSTPCRQDQNPERLQIQIQSDTRGDRKQGGAEGKHIHCHMVTTRRHNITFHKRRVRVSTLAPIHSIDFSGIYQSGLTVYSDRKLTNYLQNQPTVGEV